MRSRLVSHLPSGGIFPISTFPRPLANIQTLIAHILPPFNSWTPGHIRNEAVLLANLSDPDTAVKFARELLWIAEKLQGCSGTEVAAQQWSSESSLAELALCASPRVQMYLVRLSGIPFYYLGPPFSIVYVYRVWVPFFWQSQASVF